MKNIQGGQASKSDGRVPSAIRPKYRDGKFVKWRAKLTKEFQDCIEKGRILDAQVVQEVILMCGESHIFHVSTEGSRAKGVTYLIFQDALVKDFKKERPNTWFMFLASTYTTFFCKYLGWTRMHMSLFIKQHLLRWNYFKHWVVGEQTYHCKLKDLVVLRISKGNGFGYNFLFSGKLVLFPSWKQTF